MKRYVCLLMIGWIGLVQAQTELIPRSVLFQPQEYYNIKLDKSGERVYYQRQSAEGTFLFWVEARDPQMEFKVEWPGALIEYETIYGGGVLATLTNGAEEEMLRFWRGSGAEFQTISHYPATQIRIQTLSRKLKSKAVVLLQGVIPEQSAYYMVDVNGALTKRVISDEGFRSVHFSPFLNPIAAVRDNDDRSRSLLLFKENQWTELTNYPFDPGWFIGGVQEVVAVSEDGKTIYITDNLDRDKAALVSLDVATGTRQELIADEQVDLLPFGLMLNEKDQPEMVLGMWADAKRHFLSKASAGDFKLIEEKLETGADFVNASADHQTWLVRRMDGGPMEYFLFNRDTKNLIRLFTDLPDLEEYPRAKRIAKTITTRDGLELPVHLYFSAEADKNDDGKPDQPLPTILYVHGGPWAGVVHWNQWFHTRNFQLLANRGYLVVNTEFRGSTGMGKAMTDAGNKEWGGKMHNDLVDIADWVVAAKMAEADQIGIWGWSYGGYAASLALGLAPERFKAGIAMSGPANLDAFARIPFTDNAFWHTRVGDPNTDIGSQLLQQHSPNTYIDRIQVPLLLTTGALDERVPKTQVDAFAEAMDQAGKEVIYIYYPKEGHDYRDSGSWISFWAIAEQYLHEQLGGDFEDIGFDLEKGNYEVVKGLEFVENLK